MKGMVGMAAIAERNVLKWSIYPHSRQSEKVAFLSLKTRKLLVSSHSNGMGVVLGKENTESMTSHRQGWLRVQSHQSGEDYDVCFCFFPQSEAELTEKEYTTCTFF
jgi:hypothetical protein